MEALDKDKPIEEILQEFQRIDKTYIEFENEFTQILEETIGQYYADFLLNEDADEKFKHFAINVFNTTDSVIDKDQSYPEYRIIEELDNFKRIIQEKHSNTLSTTEFSETLSKKIKELSINHFSKIFQLSGNGFRLLELNLNHTISTFLDWFSSEIETPE